MSTPETHRSTSKSGAGLAGIASAVTAVALLAIAVALFSVASQAKQANCVDAAVAQYPAIGVSAFNTKTTGPIKLAYDAERRKAVQACL